MKKICIDIDDTLVDTGIAIEFYAKIYNKSINHHIEENTRNFSNHWYFMNMYKWNEKQTLYFLKNYYPRYLYNLVIDTQIINYLNLLEKKYRIVFLTSRVNTTERNISDYTKKWLKYSGLKNFELILCEKTTKAEEIMKMSDKPVLYIDDNFENCLHIKNLGIKALLKTTRYNSKISTKGIERINSLEEINQYLN